MVVRIDFPPPSPLTSRWIFHLGLMLGFLAAGFGAGACRSDPSPAPAPRAEPSRPPAPAGTAEAPPVVAGFKSVTGPQLRKYAEQFEHGAIVNLWASWCGSCKKELPMLKQVADAYGTHGVGLVTVSADTAEALPKAREMLDQAGLEEHAFYLATQVSAFRRAVDRRWKGAIPATFLIDQTGRVRYFWNGPVLADEIRDVVQRYLAGERVDGMTDFTVSDPPH